ncbi:NAD-dependent epimerase/dehydratase family protein [Vagococcus acidifermentans]|uniref:NAD-dependent epimerase n=1 Tax=Vagococcus acidifermentans TaxID=564710 RepID=A0A430ATU8_9ENTE|nr:NAD-dependent epimerase/dehydratase family protein [Vagococcus acidifermentans]RSU11471.1 NAD-dependent epimerase [Vagococcus acidifermentans]
MKRILITGRNSYIGTSFETYLSQFPEAYQVDTISVRGDGWREADFSSYDVLFHVAGIAHRKETKENQELYYQVNYELVKEVADKAKQEGVSQFIFMSSMSVYGMETGVITDKTVPHPKTAYGKSKLMAENYLHELETEAFGVTILRPPMVYGKDCKGNYHLLSKFAKISPIFPKIENQRSMIFIDNLTNYIKFAIDHSIFGLLTPQNNHYVKTYELIEKIVLVNNKKIHLTYFFNPLIKLLMDKSTIVSKVFGNLVYEKFGKEIKIEQVDFEKSIFLTENSYDFVEQGDT